MNKRIHSSCLLITLTLLLGLVCSAALLNAQQATPPSDQQSPSQPDAQQPSQQEQAPQQGKAPSQSEKQKPDSQAQSQQSEGQTFVGTIVKSGDKYVLQDAGGTSYDIDHQDLVKKFEGKQVRVNGTLDQDAKMIHMK
jgi:hemolysin activation/secretion protein